MTTDADNDEYLPFYQKDEVFNIKDYSGRIWRASSPEDQKRIIDEIFDYYRNKHGFPYPKLSDEEVRQELWTVRNRSPRVSDDGTIMWDHTGGTLCTHFFPHLWEVPFRGKKTAMDAFKNDEWFRDAIHLALKIKDTVTVTDIIGSFSLGTKASVGVVSRFKPMAAKAIWERYAPENGLVYDYACGWGGRLIGAASSKKNLMYIGVDPEPRTHACLLNLRDAIRQTYKDATRGAEIYKMGSEDFCPDEYVGKVDVAFSSPPYFNLEEYSDDPTQSHVKYPAVDLWLDGFMTQTFENIRKLLKPGGIVGLNMIDFDNTKIVAGAIERIRKIGFEDVETLGIQMVQRRGNGQNTTRSFKTEPVYVFRKTI
jgi:tRNA1(Val) A37 N6-methylase TrmN6